MTSSMTKLPQKFIDNMIFLLGEEGFEDYKECLSKPMWHALRVNTSKISVEEFKELIPYKLRPVPWCENGFYYDTEEWTPSKHPFYYAGLYYLQEPSAMLPAASIPIEPGDKVLDICAAPGGKSTELFCRLKDAGYLISNDISASRAKALLKNLEVFGADRVAITCEEPAELAKHFGAYFDKIIIDAPCSGEGMFRKSYSMITAWEQNGNELFMNIQHSILNEVVKMLKPDGMILYSTCTFAPLEDEQSVEYLLSKDEALELLEIPCHDGFVKGRSDWGNTDNPDMPKTVHLFPHLVEGEGHFASLFHKRPEMSEEVFANCGDAIPYGSKLTPEIKEFLSHVSLAGMKLNRLELKKERLFYLPEGCPDMTGLRILREGLLVGEQKKQRFEPSQALAMKLSPDTYDNFLSFSADDERAVKYLKGETIEITDEEKKKAKLYDGWVLIGIAGYSLGFGKLKGTTIKNKYLPGWRMQ